MPQNPIPSFPTTPSIAVSQTVGTITAHTGTYEVALNANPLRAPGGAIINHSTANTMGVQFGVHTGAAVSSDVIVATGGTLYFKDYFPVSPYTGEVVIQGTSLDVFTVIENTGNVSNIA